MNLLLDIGNTHTHAGLTHGKRISPHDNFPTGELAKRAALQNGWSDFIGKQTVVQRDVMQRSARPPRARRGKFYMGWE